MWNVLSELFMFCARAMALVSFALFSSCLAALWLPGADRHEVFIYISNWWTWSLIVLGGLLSLATVCSLAEAEEAEELDL